MAQRKAFDREQTHRRRCAAADPGVSYGAPRDLALEARIDAYVRAIRASGRYRIEDIIWSRRSDPVSAAAPEARRCSRTAAVHAAARRGTLQQRYLDALLAAGAVGLTDAEAAERLSCPVSSICSTRAALRAHLVPHGHRLGRYDAPNTVYVLRVITGARFDRLED